MSDENNSNLKVNVDLDTNSREAFVQLRTEFTEFRRTTSDSLNTISADVKSLLSEKSERAGADKMRKNYLAVALLLIPASVSAAIALLFHK